MAFDKNNLPQLPFGEGTINTFNDNLLIYKKTVKTSDGKKHRVSVYAETPQGCFKKMRAKELELENSKVKAKFEILTDAMNDWCDNVHKKTVKPQTYDRLKKTIRNQIAKHSIGSMQYQTVNSTDIQRHLDQLNKGGYSHSVIKKTHDALNAFYRYASLRDERSNPMDLVTMPRISNIQAETKEIYWLEEDEITRFVKACDSTYNDSKLKFKYGYAIAANIYLGMRGGELLALQWKDINFTKNTVFVSKTLIETDNPEYDRNDPEGMKAKGIKRVIFRVQENTKTSNNRYVPINSKARDLLVKHYEHSQYTEPDDFVISTSNRKTNTLKNISDAIKAIEAEAGIEKPCNTHILRHTCASLYFKKGVPIEVICKILGNSREVCEKTYVHFVEEQLEDAASKIDVIEI